MARSSANMSITWSFAGMIIGPLCFENADRAADNREDVRALHARAIMRRFGDFGRLRRIVGLLPGPQRLLTRLILFLLRCLGFRVRLLGCI